MSESDDLPGLVVDGKHQAIPEAVIEAAVLPFAHQARLLHLGYRELMLFEEAQQRAAGAVRVADAEMLEGLLRNSAFGDIRARGLPRLPGKQRRALAEGPGRRPLFLRIGRGLSAKQGEGGLAWLSSYGT